MNERWIEDTRGKERRGGPNIGTKRTQRWNIVAEAIYHQVKTVRLEGQKAPSRSRGGVSGYEVRKS